VPGAECRPASSKIGTRACKNHAADRSQGQEDDPMTMTRSRSLLFFALALLVPLALPASAAAATTPDGFTIEILVDGRRIPEYAARGTRYVEALKGREYAIRLRNPLPVRVAVALAVDGLNTIDARRTTAVAARKWVLGPYETVTISGWQAGPNEARRFYFTVEEESYAGWLGDTRNLGVISAVVFRERAPEPPVEITSSTAPERSDGRGRPRAAQGAASGTLASPQAAESTSQASSAKRREAYGAGRDEYAATGIGRATEHRVQQVWLDLEPHPVASLNVRYEYRAQLVKLGVLRDTPRTTPLTRRERARGFDGFCPVP
jgi:hypothetical protein